MWFVYHATAVPTLFPHCGPECTWAWALQFQACYRANLTSPTFIAGTITRARLDQNSHVTQTDHRAYCIIQTACPNFEQGNHFIDILYDSVCEECERVKWKMSLLHLYCDDSQQAAAVEAAACRCEVRVSESSLPTPTIQHYICIVLNTCEKRNKAENTGVYLSHKSQLPANRAGSWDLVGVWKRERSSSLLVLVCTPVVKPSSLCSSVALWCFAATMEIHIWFILCG